MKTQFILTILHLRKLRENRLSCCKLLTAQSTYNINAKKAHGMIIFTIVLLKGIGRDSAWVETSGRQLFLFKKL